MFLVLGQRRPSAGACPFRDNGRFWLLRLPKVCSNSAAASLLRTPLSRRSNLDNELLHLLASQDGETLYLVSPALSHNGNTCRYRPRWKHRPVRGLQRKDNLEIRPTLPV